MPAVLTAGVRFPVWPGVHSEDVAFTYDCWLHGFKVLYVPNRAEHALEPNGVGATKAQTTTFIVPVSGVLLGVLFLGEPLKPTLLLGGLLILVACALVLEIPLPGLRRRAK